MEEIEAIIKDSTILFEKRFRGILNRCESYIERVFLAFLFDYFDGEYRNSEFYTIGFIEKEVIPTNTFTIEEPVDYQHKGLFMQVVGLRIRTLEIQMDVYPQHPITYQDKQYRLDFGMFLTKGGVRKQIGVECDGHEWHSTKEQIEKDNQRMRALVGLNWNLYRYSGRELNRNAWLCIIDFESNAIDGLNAIK